MNPPQTKEVVELLALVARNFKWEIKHSKTICGVRGMKLEKIDCNFDFCCSSLLSMNFLIGCRVCHFIQIKKK
jgi:hypothetical protein